MILLYEGNKDSSIVNYKIYMKSGITKTYAPMKKAPVYHRCFFMEVFYFSLNPINQRKSQGDF